MNTTSQEGRALVEQMRDALDAERAVTSLVCPPFVHLAGVAEALRGTSIALGAQNMHAESSGGLHRRGLARHAAGPVPVRHPGPLRKARAFRRDGRARQSQGARRHLRRPATDPVRWRAAGAARGRGSGSRRRAPTQPRPRRSRGLHAPRRRLRAGLGHRNG